MALPVAIQSVVFYYLACTPCMSARTRHRAKKKFDRERKEREALEEDEPPLYRHPSPFNVNPYWQEEIMMGPSLPKKGRAAKQNSSQRKLTSAGQDSSIATRSSLAISSHGGPPNSAGGGGVLQEALSHSGSGGAGADPNAAGASGDGSGPPAATPAAITNSTPARADGSSSDIVNKTTSNNSNSGSGTNANIATNNHANGSSQTRTSSGQPPASPTLIPDDARSMSLLEATATVATVVTTTNTSIEGWNYKRYQREDEELWGAEPSSRTHKLMDAIVKAGSSAGRLLESTLGTKERGASSTTGGGAGVTDRDRANFYATTIIHPPVNDYHPPVVSSKPAHKDALRWMLQPPPPAKVMEGKVPVSRSTSVASSMTGGAPRRSVAASSDVSLTRRMALEARLRRADSGNSGATVTGHPHASSSGSIDDDAAEAAAYAAVTANLSRSVSRKAASGQSQRLSVSRGASAAARSRSGSLASSVEDPNWSSDDDGMLRTRWRFPTSAPPPMPAMPAMPALAAMPAMVPTNSTEGGFATSQSSLHLSGRPKLETILSSDASGKAGLSKMSVKKTAPRKENARPTPIKTAMAASTTATTATLSGDDDGSKTPHERSAGSSLDSGLALTS
ncbi:hypothetical protein SCUCBS95973_008887 [Sporothrix curviconia]|uniref:Signal peptide-containing protein n=1 Tax=Sporothrix curviconia TaxID=1260050 RepID=A0ABP0CQB8_9PEZI